MRFYSKAASDFVFPAQVVLCFMEMKSQMAHLDAVSRLLVHPKKEEENSC